jgi:hypothetical protein
MRDVCKNNVSLWDVLHGVGLAAFNKVLWTVARRRYPNVRGKLKKTPSEELNLRPGDWVVIKSKQEILATLDRTGRNRGLTFDSEMIPYCGKRVRVLRRVERLIDESTGRMLRPAGVSLILENVVCLARYRRSCPRSIFPYWREIWLRRDETSAAAPTTDASVPSNGELENACVANRL